MKSNTVSDNRHLSQWEIYIVKVWWSEKEKFFSFFSFCFSNFLRCFTVFIAVDPSAQPASLKMKEKTKKNLLQSFVNHSKREFFPFILLLFNRIIENMRTSFPRIYGSQFRTVRKKKLHLMHIKHHEKEIENSTETESFSKWHFKLLAFNWTILFFHLIWFDFSIITQQVTLSNKRKR